MAAKDIEAGRAHVLIAIRDRMSQGLKTAEAKLQAFGKSVALGAGVITGGIGAAIAWPIKLAANMEQTKTSFTVFLGSAELAAQKLKEIEDMAAETPFTFDELKDGAQLLLQFGVKADALMPTLKNLGDVSAGDAEKFGRLSLAFGQVMAKGRLMGQEVNQMVNAGFNPLEELSRTTGKTMGMLSDEMEAGMISSRDLAAAFATATGPGGRFNGMMAKQSQTLTGLYSTLKDNAAFAARAFGDAMMPVLKTVTRIGITFSKFIRDFIEKNQALVAMVGKVALVILAIAGVATGAGAAILAASFVVGLMASAFSTAAAAIGVLFSPLGVFIALLAVVVGNIIYFRQEIGNALSGVIAYFQPVIDSLGQLYTIFMDAFGGIVAALQAGELEQAATIAWDGFAALAWSAIADALGAFNQLLSFLDGFLPGISQMFEQTFSGIGQALIAGNWALAAEIAMQKMALALVQGWNGIKATWDMTMYGLASIWDTVVTGMQSAFRTVTYAIGQGFFFIAEQAYNALRGIESMLLSLAKTMKIVSQDSKQILDGTFATTLQSMRGRMEESRKSNQQAANSQFNKRSSDRQSFYGNREAERNKLEDFMRADIARLERQATKEGGGISIAQAAVVARQRLDDSMVAAKKEREAKALAGGKATEGSRALAGAAGRGGVNGPANTGSFSAMASILSGAGRNSAQDITARNTGDIVKLMKEAKTRGKDQPGMAT
jgi:tape measure domain-containing protein